jgi:hypothetical protein
VILRLAVKISLKKQTAFFNLLITVAQYQGKFGAKHKKAE